MQNIRVLYKNRTRGKKASDNRYDEFDFVQGTGMRSIYQREIRKISKEEEGTQEWEETGLHGMAGILFLYVPFFFFFFFLLRLLSSRSPRLGVTGHDKLVGMHRAEEAQRVLRTWEKDLSF